ncbi:thiol:disulfide interchange protein DsbG [Marinobacterium marinum]|nr:thiol:disulfide interchange protein DsbG [Marinobacterium marinum]
MKHLFQRHPLRSALTTGALLTAAAALSLNAQAEHPDAVQNLVDRGIEISETYPAPGGMTGYVGEMQGSPIAFYLTSDGEHVILGPMLSATGENLTEHKIQTLVMGPKHAKAWEKLENSHWLLDGDPSAPTVVYTFTDPNCPYCHRFSEAARPWVDAGQVQLRHVLVGILKADSLPKAATILDADNPQQALLANQEQYGGGGIDVDTAAVDRQREKVEQNTRMMRSLGLHATPSTYYRDADGQVRMQQGMPRPAELQKVMGSVSP